MPDQGHRAQSFLLGPFEVHQDSGELRKNGRKIRLPEQPFRVLQMLLERPGEVVTREEIRQHLWTEETFVDFDNGLNAAINRLRNALGDSAEHPRYIETLPRRGYRLIVPVESIKSVAPLNQSAAPAREVPQEDSEHAAAFWFLLLRSWRASWRRGIPLVILLAAVAGYFALRHTLGPPKPRADRVMLAVLPFQNLTGDPNRSTSATG